MGITVSHLRLFILVGNEFIHNLVVWNLRKAETECWKPKPDPLLEAINTFLLGEVEEWCGSATELMEQMPPLETKVKSNFLMRKLNVSTGPLYRKYGIHYEPLPRTSEKKAFRLIKVLED